MARPIGSRNVNWDKEELRRLYWDELGKIAIEQRATELRRSWYRMSELMEEMEAQ